MLPDAIDARPKVLVVDDEPTICEAVAEALPPIATQVVKAGNTTAALSALESDAFDVVLCDLYMPSGGGLEILKHADRAQLDVGLIVMTGKPQVDDIVTACRLHATDILLKPFSPNVLQAAVRTAYARVTRSRTERFRRNQLRTGLHHRVLELEDTRRQLQNSYRELIESMVVILDLREHETCAHSFRVRSYAMHLAKQINYSQDQLPMLSTAALLHDIGKIAVPDQILLKPDKLLPAEIAMLQRHSMIGEHIVLRSSMLRDSAPVIRHHHERWDGTGYPDHLAGEEIPLGARIFALADTLDAMTSDRCYRAALTIEKVHSEVDRCAGKQFDPKLVRAFQSIPDSTWIELRKDADKLAAQLNPFYEAE
ncbi:MAG TPA: HD domain-containing phosphohydrolase [Terriglobales bacterium]|nr:HD domain-containing phosphohydrolase [Terriglobales bacterium]